MPRDRRRHGGRAGIGCVLEVSRERSHGQAVYSAITSLDGYTADKNGKFDRAVPDDLKPPHPGGVTLLP